MNITLSAPPNIIAEVREWADRNGTSLNDYIRDCLEMKAGEIRSERLSQAQAFRKFATKNPIPVPPDFRFNRAEATARRPRRKSI